jgi:serine/threonine-protein kinase HipA
MQATTTMATPEPLGVWLFGSRVAELTSTRPGEVRCRYTSEALDRWPLNTPILSCSLLLSTRVQRGDIYFSGLLPEGQHRQAMAAEARLPTYDTFGLLARFGRDVAGAATISADEPGDRPGDVVPYTPDTLRAEVAELPERPLGLHEDSELSIAGLQDKLLLVDLGDGHWGRPVHGLPSTHILKVEDRRYPGMAEMEAGCLQLARAIGLTTVEVRVETIADVPCLLVSRFDRQVDGGAVQRVHQEDACQALARDPDANARRGKYQRAGGPSFREVAALLDRFADEPMAELTQLVRAMTFTVLIGNADAHGKNVALLHPDPTAVSLAPLYDTVPTALWPNLRREAAMAVGGRWVLQEITFDDVVAETRSWSMEAGHARETAIRTTTDLRERCSASGAVPPRLAELVGRRCDDLLATA